MLILATGRLADIYGRRRFFLSGVALLTLASVVGGLASSAGVLIGSRALMGFGGALVLPASLAIVSTTFHGRERGLAMAIWIATGWAATSAAPLLGGLLTELGDWRWVLWFNVPIGAAILPSHVGRVLIRGATRPIAGSTGPASSPRASGYQH